MLTAFADLAVELTDEEQVLVSRINFGRLAGSRDADSWEEVGDAMEELMRSLAGRNAIPEARLRFFDAPEYFIGGRGRSHLQAFENNGTRGADIFRHPHFVKYLRYFLYGPDLPGAVVEAFQRKIVSCGKPFTGNDALEVAVFARGLTRSHRLDTQKAPEEFYKLALDCGLDTRDARTVRDSVMKVR